MSPALDVRGCRLVRTPTARPLLRIKQMTVCLGNEEALQLHYSIIFLRRFH